MEILFALLFVYLRNVRESKVQQAANLAMARAKKALPTVVDS